MTEVIISGYSGSYLQNMCKLTGFLRVITQNKATWESTLFYMDFLKNRHSSEGGQSRDLESYQNTHICTNNRIIFLKV